MPRATILPSMKDSIIPLFEGHEIAKDMMEALDKRYGPRSDTHIQLLLDKYNNTRMGDHVN
jgi:hypothetical protein